MTSQWHKSCITKFSDIKVEQAEKRKSAEGVSPVKTRSSLGIVDNEADAEQLRCFFCE